MLKPKVCRAVCCLFRFCLFACWQRESLLAHTTAPRMTQVLPEILAQCNSGGVKTTMLFNRDGSLLATVGEDSSAEKTTAARYAERRFVALARALLAF